MILADTSVWINHLKSCSARLSTFLNDNDVYCHPYVIGELACGNLKNRTELISLLHNLPQATVADNHEVLHFIEKHRIMGKGLGLIDIHLLVSCMLTGIHLWTLDNQLQSTANQFGIALKTKTEK